MTIDKAIKLSINNIIHQGLTDIFDRPFEVDLLKNKFFLKKLIPHIKKCLSSSQISEMQIRNIDYVLLPKKTYFSFRKSALIHPEDTIKFLALVLKIAPKIEAARIPISKNRIFSYRFFPNKGYVFNTNYTYTSFKQCSSNKAKKKRVKFVIKCDIANYYDRLNIHRLENILYSIGCDRIDVKKIIELLLFWSGRNSFGLPVGSNASRILAEASLIGVDNYLMSLGVDFIRYVDDYRMFAPDAHKAQYWLTLLIDRLDEEGLMINMSKTKIEASNLHEEDRNISEKPKKNIKSKSDPFKIQAGYGGDIPTKFRALSIKERDKLSNNNLKTLEKDMRRDGLIDSEQLREYIKTCIAKNNYKELTNVTKYIEESLQLTPYYIDVLIKHSDKFTTNDLETLKNYFAKAINSKKYIPEYLNLAYVRFFGHKGFADKDILLELFRELKRNSGAYLGRAILDSLYELSNREDVLEIRKSYTRADYWEKRQIIRMVKKTFDEEESRPWLKNIKQLEINDLFMREIIEPSKKKKKKN